MSTLDVVKQIICQEMELPADRVWAYNSNIDLPTDSSLFVVLHYGERTPISNTVQYVETAQGMEEHQSVNICETVIISLLSRNTEARDRAHEVHMSFNSMFAQNLQAKERLHISILGEVWDASFLEATSRINRFDAKIKVFTSHSKIKSVDYYDKYQVETWTNQQDGQVIKQGITTEET